MDSSGQLELGNGAKPTRKHGGLQQLIRAEVMTGPVSSCGGRRTSGPRVQPGFCCWRNRKGAVGHDALGGSARGVGSDQGVVGVAVREKKRQSAHSVRGEVMIHLRLHLWGTRAGVVS